jgi:hypothetical protein
VPSKSGRKSAGGAQHRPKQKQAASAEDAALARAPLLSRGEGQH